MFGQALKLRVTLSAGPRWPAYPSVELATGTYCYQLGYAQMTSPVNVAIYAFGAFMLFALAVGFFATPV